jgi:hypothetical protein
MANTTKTQIEIPQSVVEYTLTFESPVIPSGDARVETVTSVLAAMKPWGFSLDGLETKLRSDKANEHAYVFRRTVPARPAASLALFYNKIFISGENLDWEGADEFIKTMSAGIEAVRGILRPKIASQNLVAGLHIQLKDRPTVDVVRPLLNAQAFKLIDGETKFSGVIVTGQESNVIIEASLVYANALWVRLFRDHSGGATFQEIAEALRADEERLFEVLGLEGIL